MTDSEGSLQRAGTVANGQDAAPPRTETPAFDRPPVSRPRSFTTPPPDPTEALYYEGMAAYQHRNWEEALARFSRLKEQQPTRPGLDALLDEVRWFLQLQAAAPNAPALSSTADGFGDWRRVGGSTGPGAVSRGARLRRHWQTALILILAAVGVIALLLIAFQGRLPWSNNAERGAQELYNRGQARLAVGDYEGAYAAFKRLLEVAPDDPEAQLGLKRAERQQTLAQGYAAAEAAIAEENWDKAAAELEKVLAVDSSYTDAQAKADFVAQQQRLANLYHDGGRLYDLGQWQDAIVQFQKIREVDSSYRTEAVNEFLFSSYLNVGQALITNADSALPTVQRAVEYFSDALAIKPRNRQAADARRLGGLYLDGLRAESAGNTAEAQARFEALFAEDPNYAGGEASRKFYAFLLQQADAAVATGDIGVALRLYGAAQNVPVSDHNSAAQGAAYARSITPTPTPRPTSAPRSTALSPAPTPYAMPHADAVNLRAGPGLSYPVLGQVRPSERVALIGRNSEASWLRVCTGGGSAEACPSDQLGWVSAGQMDVQGASEALPQVTPPPMPTVASALPRATPTPASAAACIQGRVLDTHGGAPLAGWEITLQGSDDVALSQNTGNTGVYQFSGLAAGVYTVTERPAAYWRAVSPQTATVTVAPGPVCVAVDFWNERGEGPGVPAPLR